MKNLFLGLSIFLTILSCKNGKEPEGFTLTAIVKEIPDSSVVYLNVDSRNIDSTIVQKESFKFEGNVEGPTNAVIIIKNSRDYKFLWLENSQMNFIAKKGDFRNSKITGSNSQIDEDELQSRLAQKRKKNDSLNSLLMKLDKDSENYDSAVAQYDSTLADMEMINQEYIEENPDSPVSLNTLNVYKTTWGKDKTEELFAFMDSNSKKSENGKAIFTYLELYGNPKVGQKYIDFQQEDTDGNLVKVSDVLGQYTLIEFWASWCGPCRNSNPDLVKLYKDYNDSGFEILGVSLDDNRSNWLKAIDADKLTWTNISDLKGSENEGAIRYGVNGIPDNVLIDSSGTIVGRYLKPEDLREIFEKKLISNETGIKP